MVIFLYLMSIRGVNANEVCQFTKNTHSFPETNFIKQSAGELLKPQLK